MSAAETVSLDYDEIEEDTQRDRYLTFSLDSESYGISITNVIEIIGIQPVTEMPGLPGYIKGVINLRGRIIPVIDARLRFNKALREYNDRTCIIIVELRDNLIGLIVDHVSEVLTIPDSEIVEPPNINKNINRYINGIGKVDSEVKLLLDLEKFISYDKSEILSDI
jgi:purine-binding chemotaxis protein CheW